MSYINNKLIKFDFILKTRRSFAVLLLYHTKNCFMWITNYKMWYNVLSYFKRSCYLIDTQHFFSISETMTKRSILLKLDLVKNSQKINKFIN